MTRVVVSAPLDRFSSGEFRFLEEAARLGEVHVLLWPDAAVRALAGREPKYPEAERRYVLAAVRHVTAVHAVDAPPGADALPAVPPLRPDLWVVDAAADTPAKRAFCAAHGLGYRAIPAAALAGFPGAPPAVHTAVIVTGCYDMFHSGHVRFFEEVAALGELTVVLGHDANVRHLKGPGHPLFGEAERRYLVASIRHVRQALVSTGMGWLDAEPEIAMVRPAIYAVNEDGDRPEKREFCQHHGIRYVVLKRLPKPGLPRRSSTDLRGF
jgi:cytidyltransferase-like protein